MKARSISLAVSAISICVLSACAPQLGRTVDTPEIPITTVEVKDRVSTGKVIGIGELRDARAQFRPGDKIEGFTEPAGDDVSKEVSDSLRKAFFNHGVDVSERANITARGEIVKWRTQVEAKTSTSIQSEASITLQLLDSAQNVIYNATYQGTRKSEFPVASKHDIQYSLGLAMAEALDQAASDPKLTEYLAR